MSGNSYQHPLLSRMEEEFGGFLLKLESPPDHDLETMLGLVKDCSEAVGDFIQSRRSALLLICTPLQPESLRRLEEILGLNEQ